MYISDQVWVARKVYNAIHWSRINHYPVDFVVSTVIHRIAINVVDSVIFLSNNWGQCIWLAK